MTNLLTPLHVRVQVIFVILLGLSISRSALAASGEQAVPTSIATIQTGDEPTHAVLRVNGRLLLDQPGAHMGRPQRSLDGQMVAVVLTPTGNATEALAQIQLFDSTTGRRLATLNGHTPQWQSDGQLVYQAATSRFRYDPATGQQSNIGALLADPDADGMTMARVADAEQRTLTYPQTIRVLHHASNNCRDVAAGQVDEIAFEEYLARVVPAEMPAFWQFAALAAQAVAARTYAWQQILVGRPTYDVTDWVNFQAMCDDRYPITDAAVAETAGQYLSAAGDPSAWPISAMYSAENGHPTLTNPNVNYLQAVPDLFALGKIRFGHGYGLSQWGAQRRALAGHSYRQILGHYYTNIHLQDARNPGQPRGGFIEPTPGSFVTSNALRWRTLTSLAAANLAVQLTSNTGSIAPDPFTDRVDIWRAPFALPTNALISTTLTIEGELQDHVVVTVDQTPPAPPSLNVASVITGATLPLNVHAEANSLISISQDWVWQGETLSHTVNSGVVVSDTNAVNGLAWAARAGVDQRGAWYGPYTRHLPAGRSYRAIFWLRTNALTTTLPVARLDVTDQGGDVILGLRDVWSSDFMTTTTYQPLAVDFYLFAPAQGLEFRIAWPGNVDLALDQVQVWTRPTADWPATSSFDWPLYGGDGQQNLYVTAFDQAGNLSQPVSRTIQVIDHAPPQFGEFDAPTDWFTGAPLALTVAVTDSLSGLDFRSAVLLVAGNPVNATLDLAANPWEPQTLVATANTSAEGEQSVAFQITDRAGNLGQSEPIVIRFVKAQQVYLPLVAGE